ncbi:MAG TPA: lytic transglycosylase domain-containing protein, partial [Candidatus Hydrogenedentes bacterium]|nr:lytic transglycosylase domain-containing protein [Candidatus Hydrogenedentota bacterium]
MRSYAKTFERAKPRTQRRGLLKAPRPEDVSKIRPIVEHYAAFYKLDPALVLAVIRVESNFQPSAKSPAGACGLMQLMPGTAADMGIGRDSIFNAVDNIAGGTQYLARQLERFGQLELALAAYNAGPGNVMKYHNEIPPFPETQRYVPLVLAHYEKFKRGELASKAELPLTDPEREAGAYSLDVAD